MEQCLSCSYIAYPVTSSFLGSQVAVAKRMYFPSDRFKATALLVDLLVFRTFTGSPWLVYTSMDMLLGDNIGGVPLAMNCTDEPFLILTTSDGSNVVTFFAGISSCPNVYPCLYL